MHGPQAWTRWTIRGRDRQRSAVGKSKAERSDAGFVEAAAPRARLGRSGSDWVQNTDRPVVRFHEGRVEEGGI